MTDQELLERAAKAAGIDGFWVDAGLNVGSNATPILWNPLTDDGDALRLAVKLHMDFTLSGRHAAVAQAGINAIGQECCNGDPEAATRRAIVRAAAAIGEAMP